MTAKGVNIFKISVTFGSDSSEPSNKKKKAVHKKPWFWLMIILIASVAVRMTSRNQPKIPFIESDNDDVSSTFTFKPDSEKFKVKEDSMETENNYEEEPVDEVSDVNGDDGIYKEVNQNEDGKSVFHFILNISTKKYHTKECSAVKKLAEEKRLDTDIEAESAKEAKKIIEGQGSSLCGLCDR